MKIIVNQIREAFIEAFKRTWISLSVSMNISIIVIIIFANIGLHNTLGEALFVTIGSFLPYIFWNPNKQKFGKVVFDKKGFFFFSPKE